MHVFTFVGSPDPPPNTSSFDPSTARLSQIGVSPSQSTQQTISTRQQQRGTRRKWHASSCWCYCWQCPPSMPLRIMVRLSVIDEEEELTSLFDRRNQDQARCRPPPEATTVDCTNDDGTLTKGRVRGVSNVTPKFGMVAWRRYVA
jgi:hypothetical protein